MEPPQMPQGSREPALPVEHDDEAASADASRLHGIDEEGDGAECDYCGATIPKALTPYTEGGVFCEDHCARSYRSIGSLKDQPAGTFFPAPLPPI